MIEAVRSSVRLRRGSQASGCTAETKACEFWRKGGDYVRPDCCTSHLMELALFGDDLLSRQGIAHWVDFGTLLGAVRDQQLVPWEWDVDFGIFESDVDRILALETEVTAAGFCLRHEGDTVRFYYSAVNSLHLDLYPWRKRDGWVESVEAMPEWPGMAGRSRFPAEYLESPDTVVLYGHPFPAPSPPGRFLSEHRYGPDYMTPTRMAMNTALYPQTTGADLTPAVRDALERLGERERHLTAVIDGARPFGLSFPRRWITSGLPIAPDADRIRHQRESRADVESTPVLDALLESLALVEQAIDEFENPAPDIVFRRAYRRLVRAKEIAAAKIGRRRHRAGFPYGVE